MTIAAWRRVIAVLGFLAMLFLAFLWLAAGGDFIGWSAVAGAFAGLALAVPLP